MDCWSTQAHHPHLALHPPDPCPDLPSDGGHRVPVASRGSLWATQPLDDAPRCRICHAQSLLQQCLHTCSLEPAGGRLRRSTRVAHSCLPVGGRVWCHHSEPTAATDAAWHICMPPQHRPSPLATLSRTRGARPLTRGQSNGNPIPLHPLWPQSHDPSRPRAGEPLISRTAELPPEPRHPRAPPAPLIARCWRRAFAVLGGATLAT